MALLPSFPPEIAKQVNVRQEKLNLSQALTNEDILFRTNTGTFIRLTSGINVTDDIIKNLGLSGVTSGNDLAKKYKLFSARFQRKTGTDKNDIFTEAFSQGVGYSTTYPTSYGFTSSPEFGYTPPPGITSIDVKTLNKGGLRSATINIIAHNILQFNIIDTLYLKLRYSMILEWGHNIYYNNKKELINNSIDLSGEFLDSNKSLSKLLSSVESNKVSSNGNYDALIGVAKNFTWNLMENGSYQITIDLISVGDIAESIQINTCLNYTTSNPSDSLWLNPIQYNRSSLDRILAWLKWELDNPSTTSTISQATGLTRGYTKTGGNYGTTPDTYKIPFSNLEMANDNTTPVSQYYIKFGLLLKIIESWLLEYDSAHDNEPTVFLDYDYDENFCFTLTETISSDPLTCLVSLGAPDLSKVKKYIQYSSAAVFVWNEGTFDMNGNRSPGKWVFDYWDDYDGVPTDIIPTGTTLNSVWWRNPATGATKELEGQPTSFYESANKDTYWPFSRGLPADDPNRVGGTTFTLGTKADLGDRVISYTIDNPERSAFADDGILDVLDKNFRVTGNPYKGKLMHVLLNINFLHRCLENNIDSDGKIPLTTFLEDVLEGIQSSLGYINDFTVSYNNATNTIRILDNTYLSILYNSIDPTTINVNKVTSKEGGFVKDYSLKSEVFSKQGNVLMSGAQENGNTGIANGSTFTELYKGSTDRVVTLKRNKNTESSSGALAKTQMTTLFDAYKTFRLKLTQASGTLSVEDIESFKSSIKDYYQYDIGQLIQKTSGGLPANKLVPLNLQLTLHGLSGIDIHQLFTVNSTLLPSDYTGRTAFVIRELTHKVDDKGWETNIGSLTILKKTKQKSNQSELEIEDSPVYVSSHSTSTPQTGGNNTSLKYIAIGDSQTPAIASKSNKVELVSSTEGVNSLWKVGEGIQWLTNSVKSFGTSPDTKAVVVSIGTNGGYATNATQASDLLNALNSTFPNAHYVFVPGS